MATFARGFQHFALLVLRLAVGGALGLHAWYRWSHGMDAQIDNLTQHGVPSAVLVAWLLVVVEALSGLLIVLGLATRVMGALVLVEQGLIIAWLTWYKPPFIEDGGWEYSVVLGVTGLVLLAYGGGKVALDVLFRSTKTDTDPTMAP